MNPASQEGSRKFDIARNTFGIVEKYIRQFGPFQTCPDRIVQAKNKRRLFVSLFSQIAFRHDMAAQWHEKYVEHMESVHNGQEHAG